MLYNSNGPVTRPDFVNLIQINFRILYLSGGSKYIPDVVFLFGSLHLITYNPGKMDRYLKILKSYKRMPLEMERTLIASVQRITVKKHEIIQQEGIYNDCIYFVEKGLFRIFSIESGNEITWRFKWEDDFIIALKHLAHGSTLPADSIDAVEDGILWILPAALISQLEKYLAFQFQYRLMIEKEMMSMIDAKRCSDPGGGEKNYRYLCAYAPELADRVPLPYLANYTGIPEKVLGHLRATKIRLNFSTRRKKG